MSTLKCPRAILGGWNKHGLVKDPNELIKETRGKNGYFTTNIPNNRPQRNADYLVNKRKDTLIGCEQASWWTRGTTSGCGRQTEMSDVRCGHKMELQTFQFRMSNELVTVFLEPSRSITEPEETPYPPGNLTIVLFVLPPGDSLVNRYLLLTQGRLQTFV